MQCVTPPIHEIWTTAVRQLCPRIRRATPRSHQSSGRDTPSGAWPPTLRRAIRCPNEQGPAPRVLCAVGWKPTYDQDSIAPIGSRKGMELSPTQRLAMARRDRRPVEMAGAAVAAMGRQTLIANLAERDGKSRAGRGAGRGRHCRCGIGRLVVHASNSALRDLLGEPARPDRIRRQRHLVDQTAEVVFSESVAPLKQMQKAVTTGITLSPAVAGAWFWTTDKELQFTPKDDWPVDGDFSVQFARKGFFADGVLLEGYRIPVRSQPFSATIAESQFYQDPRDPNLKKLVATLKFSSPRRYGTTRIARLACGRQGCRISRTDARQPALHRRVRQVQAGGLHPFRGLGDAARRHADDAEHRSRGARRARRQRHARPAAGGRHDPGPHQPALLQRAHDHRRQRAL